MMWNAIAWLLGFRVVHQTQDFVIVKVPFWSRSPKRINAITRKLRLLAGEEGKSLAVTRGERFVRFDLGPR